MRGRPQTPLAKAKLTGAANRDKKRHAARHRRHKSGPIGKPPADLNETELYAWREFVTEIPWLEEADRRVVELASRCVSEMRHNRQVGVRTLSLLKACLTEMGATPAARGKVAGPPSDEDEDPAQNYLN